MASKLYVRNLPYSMTEAELEELFTPHGTVQSVRIITDRESGRSRGFGFVEMGSDEEAETAISKVNNQEIDGRQLMVAEALPPKENSR